MRVCYLPCDFDGSGQYRCVLPGRSLAAAGHECVVPRYRVLQQPGALTRLEFDFDASVPDPDADLYVMQRRMEASLVGAGFDRLRAAGRRIVVDTDDLYDGMPAYSPARHGSDPFRAKAERFVPGRDALAWRRSMSEALGALSYSRDWLHYSIAAADHVTVSTPFLADRYSRLNKNVSVVRNYLNWPDWETVTPQHEVERRKLRVGWMGQLFWRAGDLAVIKPVLSSWLHRHPEVEFVAAGGGDEVHDALGVPVGQRVSVPGGPFRDGMVPDITATMDIGLVPLQRNDFNEAKSWLKGLEYAACGIPCVATPTGEYREWVDDGDNGFLAARPRDWVAALDELAADDALRREMGRKARAKAERHTLQKHWQEWERVYELVLQ